MSAMRNLRVILFYTVVVTMALSFIMTTDTNTPSICDTENMTAKTEFFPSTSEFYAHVSGVYSWSFGLIDQEYPGQPGFSLTNLQSDNGIDADLHEVKDPFNARFEYIFSIDTSEQINYLSSEVQVEGYCGESEALDFYWSDTTTGLYTSLFSLTETSNTQKTESITVSTDTIYIKVIDTTHIFDGIDSHWYLDYIRVRFSDSPNSNVGVSVDRLFDYDNLYPGLGDGINEYYVFTCEVSDDDGGSTVDEVTLTAKDGSTSLWTVKWNGAWMESSISIELVSNACSTSVLGIKRYVLFAVSIFFDHPESDNVDWELFSATSTSNDTDSYNHLNGKNVDIKTELSWNSPPTLQSSRWNPGAEIGLSGSVVFADSSTGVTPQTVYAVVDRTQPTSPAWADTQILMDGAFSFSCETSGSAGDMNEFEVTINELVTFQEVLATAQDDVTLDTIESHSYGTMSDWINTGSSTIIYTKLRYASDGTPITGGTVSWNGIPMSYDPIDGRWEGWTSTEGIPVTRTYDTLSVTTPEGVTDIQVHPSTSVTWDEVRVNAYLAFRESDDIEIYSVNLGEEMFVIIQLQYVQNGGWVSDGSVEVNGYSFTYTGSTGIWRTTTNLNPSWVGEITMDNVVFTSAPSSGIIVVDQNDLSCTILWDALMVELSVNDSHASIGESVTIWANVTRAFDGSVMTSGSVKLRHLTSGDITMEYDLTSRMWYANVSASQVESRTYYIHEISDSINDLYVVASAAYFNGASYVDCGSDSSLDLTSSLTVSLWFKGTGPDWDGGMYLLSKKNDNDAQYALYVHADGTLKFTYFSTVLREVNLKAGVSRNVWHHVVVTVSGTMLNCWYDGVHVLNNHVLEGYLTSFPTIPLYVGATLSGSVPIYHLEGYVNEGRIYNSALGDAECLGIYHGCYPIASPELHLDRVSLGVEQGEWLDHSEWNNDGALFGVTVGVGALPTILNERVLPVWTEVKVSEYSVADPVISTGQQVDCSVTLLYAHDASFVESGTVEINDIPASYSGEDGVWVFSDTNVLPQQETYDLVQYSGGCYDLDSVNQNGQSLQVIWDEILVTLLMVDDERIDIGATAEIRVRASLSYHDAHLLGLSDTIYLNGEEMLWSVSGSYFYYHTTHDQVGSWFYEVDLTDAYETTYGITSVNRNGTGVEVIWDSLIATITDPLDQWLSIGENATGIHCSVIYSYDGTIYDGTISLNNSVFTYHTEGKQGYTLLPPIGDDSYGISNLTVNDETWCIWDSLIVSISDPVSQTLLIGQNASGIILDVRYAHDGLPFDGLVILNETQFSFDTPGQRGYSVLSVSGGSRGIDVISVNDETHATWVKEAVTLHVLVSSTTVPVSTEYDPQGFEFLLWIQNSSHHVVSGWINLSISGVDKDVYCSSYESASFTYYPTSMGSYTLTARFAGDSYYSPASNITSGLTAVLRELTFDAEIPSSTEPLTQTPITIIDVFDTSFQGLYQNTTYLRNYPVDGVFSVKWTVSPDYHSPMHTLGTWNISAGSGTGIASLPWDLDGDSLLTSIDFEVFILVEVDGLGVYKNATYKQSIRMVHPVQLHMDLESLIYSDSSEITTTVSPFYDHMFTKGLDLSIEVFVSSDNDTWVLLQAGTTDANGKFTFDWLCKEIGTLFFKAETSSSNLYLKGTCYSLAQVDKESTLVSIIKAESFTYSDQGVLVGHVTSDDGEPLADQPVYLELWDGVWTSIGSGVTNGTGHVSILWIPTLQPETYSIQLRSPFADSSYYNSPDNAGGQLVVQKETLVIVIETSAVQEGYIIAIVTDDEGVPVPGLDAHLFIDNNSIPRQTASTNNEGVVYFSTSLNDGQTVHVSVSENDYYLSAANEEVVVILPDIILLTVMACGVIIFTSSIAFYRKTRQTSPVDPPIPSPEVISELEKEREAAPERIKELSERRKEEIEDIEGDEG